MSITKPAVAALLVGCALFAGTPDARAQMSSDAAFDAALDQCQGLPKGQRSFCMINATNHYQVQAAAEKKQDATIVVDNDASNDKPAHKAAKESFNAAADKCADLPKGQRSLCMIDAYNEFDKAMGN
jgi:hypothetical protein